MKITLIITSGITEEFGGATSPFIRQTQQQNALDSRLRLATLSKPATAETKYSEILLSTIQ